MAEMVGRCVWGDRPVWPCGHPGSTGGSRVSRRSCSRVQGWSKIGSCGRGVPGKAIVLVVSKPCVKPGVSAGVGSR